MTDYLNIPLTSPPLSGRAHRCLTAAGYQTLADVAALSRDELRRIPGIGPICYREVVRLIRDQRSAHARALLAQGRSLRQAGRELGVSGECVRKWTREAREA